MSKIFWRILPKELVCAEISTLLSVDSSYEEYWKQHGTKKDHIVTNYLEWKAETRSIVPILFRLNRQLMVSALMTVLVLTFSMRPNKKDVEEILFRPCSKLSDPLPDSKPTTRVGASCSNTISFE